jgi:hypothetical protein
MNESFHYNHIPTHTTRASKGDNPLVKLLILVVLIVVIVVVASASQINKRIENRNQKTTEQTEQQVRSQIIQKVGSLIELPQSEPQIALVSDISKITEPVFVNAQNGDIVLAYPEKTIIYRPTTNKIITIGESILGPVQTDTAIASDATEVITLDILNGTKTPKLAAEVSQLFTVTNGNPVIQTVDSAKNTTPKTIVYRMNPEISDESLSAVMPDSLVYSVKESSDYPTNEASTTADVVIVVGSDFVQN